MQFSLFQEEKFSHVYSEFTGRGYSTVYMYRYSRSIALLCRGWPRAMGQRRAMGDARSRDLDLDLDLKNGTTTGNTRTQNKLSTAATETQTGQRSANLKAPKRPSSLGARDGLPPAGSSAAASPRTRLPGRFAPAPLPWRWACRFISIVGTNSSNTRARS